MPLQNRKQKYRKRLYLSNVHPLSQTTYTQNNISNLLESCFWHLLPHIHSPCSSFLGLNQLFGENSGSVFFTICSFVLHTKPYCFFLFPVWCCTRLLECFCWKQLLSAAGNSNDNSIKSKPNNKVP